MMHLIQGELLRNGVSEGQIIALTFESRMDARVQSLDSVLEVVRSRASAVRGGRLYLFLDEVQELVGWETLVNSFLVDLDVDLYVTGSNARLLSGELATYLADHGIREAIYGSNQRDINQVLENIVYMELLRRGYEVTVGKAKNAEVDFCAQRGAEKLYVQGASLLASDETVEREFGALEAIADNYPKFVLSRDELNRSRNGIIHKDVRSFLLES